MPVGGIVAGSDGGWGDFSKFLDEVALKVVFDLGLEADQIVTFGFLSALGNIDWGYINVAGAGEPDASVSRIPGA